MGKYFWPASRLDDYSMGLLYRKREALKAKGTEKPISVLLKECVDERLADYTAKQEEDRSDKGKE